MTPGSEGGEDRDFWPTPTSTDYKGGVSWETFSSWDKDKQSRKGGLLRYRVVNEEHKRMWGTPMANDCKGGMSDEAYRNLDPERKNWRKNKLRFMPNIEAEHNFPTPRTTGLCGGSGAAEMSNQLAEAGVISEEERKSFRAGNGGQLNPDWTEWLMDWPIGWTSLEPLLEEDYRTWEEMTMDGIWWDEDPAETGEGIPRVTTECSHRRDRIRAIGNGQVSLCAAFAQVLLSGEVKK